MPDARTARSSVVVVAMALAIPLSGVLAACGDSSSSSRSASKADFCAGFEKLGSRTKPSVAADELSRVGTPSDIDAEARRGFDLLVHHLRDIPDVRSPSGITRMMQNMSAADAADVRAFITYYASECQGVPSDAPS